MQLKTGVGPMFDKHYTIKTTHGKRYSLSHLLNNRLIERADAGQLILNNQSGFRGKYILLWTIFLLYIRIEKLQKK
jgi:hypothetical protein